MASTSSTKRRNLINFGYGLYIWLFACALSFGYFEVVSSPHPLALRNGGQLLQADFVRFYTCGRMARSEDRLRVYDDRVQLKWLNSVLTPEKVDLPPFIQYPPIAFLLLVPFTYLSLLDAYNLWNFLACWLRGLCSCGALITESTAESNPSGQSLLC